MRILVTGAAGFIGSHLAERLHGAGHDVVGVDNLSDYYDRAIKEQNTRLLRDLGVETTTLDLATDKIPASLAEAEIVCHLAAQPGISAAVSFDQYLRNNLVATERLTAACQATGATRCFVNCATSSVYGRIADSSEEMAPAPISHYGVTKLAAEQHVMSLERQLDFPACSLRLFSVYGPRERPDKMFTKLLVSLRDGTSFPLCEGSPSHRRSFTFVADVIDAFVAAVDHPEAVIGQIFNIGNDADVSVGEAIALAEEVTGRKAKFVAAPPRQGDQEITRAAIDKARRALGYAPRTSLREGIAAQARWIAAGR